MNNRLLLGRYIQGDSWVHRLDPRTKLLASFYYILIVFMANNLWGYLTLITFVLVGVLVSQIDLGFFLRGIRPMAGLILFTVLFQILFTRGGDVYWEWGIFTISQHGLQGGFFIFMRLIAIILMSTLLTLTTSPLELTDGIESLLRPLTKLGFPSHEVALMLSIALRYVPTLMDEATTIMDAQRSRGVDFEEGGLLVRIKAIIPLLIPLFISAFNRAEEMAIAMEARGYQGGEGRTNYRQLSYSSSDYIALLALILLTLVLWLIRS